MLTLKQILILCLAIAVSACGKSQEEKRLEENKQKQALEQKRIQAEKLAKEKEAKIMVKELSFDPDTVKFQKVNGYCGEMNTKNKLGAYVGYRRYMISNFGEDNEKQAFVAGMSVSDNPRLDEIVNFEFEQKWLVECEGLKINKSANLEQCSKESMTAFMVSDFYLKFSESASFKDIKNVLLENHDNDEKKNIINILNELRNMDKKGNAQMLANPKDFSKDYGLAKYKACVQEQG